MTLRIPLLWTTAALLEASRLRSPQTDVEHLYLGLLCMGGDAARLLARHGITLGSARERVRQAMEADLTTLGLPEAGALIPPPLDAHQIGDLDWRPTQAAKTLVDQSHPADTYGILIALLKEPSGVVRRLVHADGVVPQDLAPALHAGSDEQYTAERTPVRPGVLPEPARAHLVRRFVPVVPTAAADALADPTLLRLWALDPRTSTWQPGDEVATHRRGRREMTLRYHHTRRTEGDTEVVTWIQEVVAGPHAGEPLLYDRFELRPAPGGCELVRESGRRRFGVLGRLLAPGIDALANWGLLHGTQRLALGIVDHASR